MNYTSFFSRLLISENQQIQHPLLKEKNIQLFIKREDLIDTEVAGNKFRKLKYTILEASKQQKKSLLTFGGAFSNHILATAIAGKISGFKTIGIIRGDELGKNLEETLSKNSTLRLAHEHGMEFLFVSREEYRKKTTPKFIENLYENFEDFYLIPEGGTNLKAIEGCQEILTEKDIDFDYICCAVGTGGTIAGLINAAQKHQKIIGFPALKGNFLTDEIARFVTSKNQWELQKNYHFGGYGKYSEALISFINQFKKITKIPLDPIYTGKMLFGIFEEIKKSTFPKGSKIIAIHTGGIQGIAEFNQKLKNKNESLICIEYEN